LTTNVAAATAPAGTLVPASPSPDRVQATATGDIAGAELVAILGPPDAPGTRAQAQTVASSVGATLIGGSESLGAYQLLYPPGTNLDTAKANLAMKPGVVAATSNGVAGVGVQVVPNDWSDDGPDKRWPWELIQAPTAWGMSTGSSVKVGVVDGDFYPAHEDLSVAVATQAPLSSQGGHGTHVAGLSCARANNSKGLTGAAWGCPVVYSQGLRGDSTTDLDIADAMRIARDSGAKVVNISLGVDSCLMEPDGSCKKSNGRPIPACAEASWSRRQSDASSTNITFSRLFDAGSSKGVVWTVSAGNNCSPFAEYALQGVGSKYPNVLVVAAVNSDNTLARFSNSGSWVDVAAPGGVHVASGQGVWSSVPMCDPLGLGLGSCYGAKSGTSMAAPIVAGVAALVREEHPTYSATQVADCIRQSGPRGGKKVSPRSSLPTGDAPKQNADLTNLYIVDAAMAVSCDGAVVMTANGLGPVSVGTAEAQARSVFASLFGPPTREWSGVPGEPCSEGSYVEYANGALYVRMSGGSFFGYGVRVPSTGGHLLRTGHGFSVGDSAQEVVNGTPGVDLGNVAEGILVLEVGFVAWFEGWSMANPIQGFSLNVGCA
jgi:subtilisin family serine protease